MLKTYLNTIDSEFYDADGNLWRDNFPQLIVGGHEEIRIILCTNTDNASTDLADPENWERDVSYANINGISALLTVDSDSIHYIKGSLSTSVNKGAVSVSAVISADYSTIPDSGVIRIYSEIGEAEYISYTSRSVDGNTVTFALGTALKQAYSANSIVDVQQAPICQAYIDKSKSNLANGELVFNLVCDSDRLRALTDYSNSDTISIKGIELLFYVTDENNYVRKLRAYLWDTPSLRNSMGDPAFPAPLPDPLQDTVAELVRTLAPDVSNFYTKSEIDTMFGEVESKLAEI